MMPVGQGKARAPQLGRPFDPNKPKVFSQIMALAMVLKLQAGKVVDSVVDGVTKYKPAVPGGPALVYLFNRELEKVCKTKTGKRFDDWKVTVDTIGTRYLNSLRTWYQATYCNTDLKPELKRDDWGNVARDHFCINGVDAEGNKVRVIDPQYADKLNPVEFEFTLEGLPEQMGRTSTIGEVNTDDYVDFDFGDAAS